MQKKYLALLCVVLTISMITIPVHADWRIGGVEVFTFRSSNAALHGIDYNTTAKILRFIVSSINRSTFNIGLACIEIAFNNSHAPAANPASFKAYLVIDNVTYDLMDQVKNVTFNQNAVFVNWDGNYTRECFFLQGYVYLFENHSITDERSMEGYLLWNRMVFNEGEVPLTDPYPPPEPPQQSIMTLANDDPTGPSVAVLIDYAVEVTGIDPIIIGVVAGIGAGFVIILILFLIKKRQTM